MIEVNRIKLPTYFEVVEEKSDSRFKKVKIFVAHTGENLNNSIFEKDVLEKMAPSLLHCPILGYISNNPDNEKDFRTHEKHYSLKSGGLKVNFGTRAYGFVGEDHNAHFEIVAGKEWLVCEGYIWTRFTDVIELFNQSNGTKGQSMEIVDAAGFVDDEGRVVYQDGKFSGLCILGDDIPPAMTGATISTEFSQSEVKALVEEMLAEFTAEKGEHEMSVKKTNDEGTEDVKTPEENPIDQVEPETPVEPEVQKEEHDSNGGDEEQTDETTEVEPNQEDNHEAEQEENESENDGEGSEEGSEFAKESKFKLEFELSHEDQRCALYEAFRELHKDDDVWVWIQQVFDDRVIVSVEDYENGTHHEEVKYAIVDDKVILGESVVMVEIFVTEAEKAQIDSQRDEIKTLNDQLQALETFKSETEMAAKKAILEAVKTQLPSEQIHKVESQFEKLSVEEVEKEIAYVIFQANKEQMESEKPEQAAVFATNTHDNKPTGKYGDMQRYFHK